MAGLAAKLAEALRVASRQAGRFRRWDAGRTDAPKRSGRTAGQRERRWWEEPADAETAEAETTASPSATFRSSRISVNRLPHPVAEPQRAEPSLKPLPFLTGANHVPSVAPNANLVVDPVDATWSPEMYDELIYRTVAKNCDLNTNMRLADIIDKSKQDLLEIGIPSRALDVLADLDTLQNAFRPVFIPNPQYWHHILKRKISFYTIKTPADRYQDMLALLATMPDVAHYVCYGKYDVLVRSIGREEQNDNLESVVSERGFQIRQHRVEAVPIFYGFPVDPTNTFENTTISAEEIDSILLGDAHGADADKVRQLVKAGVILGTVYREDHRKTGRLRAFIGVSLRDEISRGGRRRFESGLSEINPSEIHSRQSEPLISVYRCSSSLFPYLIQLICDNQTQLDDLTDYILDYQDVVYDTTTLIVAKYGDNLPHYSELMNIGTERYVAVRDISERQLLPRIDHLYRKFPHDVRELFSQTAPERQLTVLTLSTELDPLFEPLNSTTKTDIDAQFVDLCRALLRGSETAMRNVGLAVARDVIEPAHLDFSRVLVRTAFGDDISIFQDELKMSNTDYERWTLGKWYHFYEQWNKHPVYGSIFNVPEDVLWALQMTNSGRNHCAHSRRDTDARTALHVVRDIFYHGSALLVWLPEAHQRLANPTLNGEQLWKIINDRRVVSNLKMLIEIRNLQLNIVDIMEEHDKRASVELANLAGQIQEVSAGQIRADGEFLRRFEELISPLLEPQERSTVKASLDYLRTSAGSLPPNIIGSLLATILTHALHIG